MIEMFGLAIPCLIWAFIVFLILDVIALRWMMTLNIRILVFLSLFALSYGSACRDLRSMNCANSHIKSRKIATVAESYDEIVNDETRKETENERN